jgi:hypothetical protein
MPSRKCAGGQTAPGKVIDHTGRKKGGTRPVDESTTAASKSANENHYHLQQRMWDEGYFEYSSKLFRVLLLECESCLHQPPGCATRHQIYPSSSRPSDCTISSSGNAARDRLGCSISSVPAFLHRSLVQILRPEHHQALVMTKLLCRFCSHRFNQCDMVAGRLCQITIQTGS